MVQFGRMLVLEDPPDFLQPALDSFRLMGTKEFFVSNDRMAQLVQYILQSACPSKVILNRPQVGGERLVHKIEWEGIRFFSVSRRPIAVG